MPSYDPKRPRPAAAGTQDVAPIEEILDPVDGASPTEESLQQQVEGLEPGAPRDGDAARPEVAGHVDEVDLRVAPGVPDEPLLQAGGSDVPVAPAPEGDTANRAVVAAVLVGLAALVAVIVLVRRRRN